jgi:hypothetical protein
MAKMAKYKQQILDEFEARTDDWKFGTFENRLREISPKNGHYQNAKMIISEAHDKGLWPKTVERYVRTLYETFNNLPSELNNVGRDVLWNNT